MQWLYKAWTKGATQCRVGSAPFVQALVQPLVATHYHCTVQPIWIIQRHLTRYWLWIFCHVFQYISPLHSHTFGHTIYHWFKYYVQNRWFCATHPTPFHLFDYRLLHPNQSVKLNLHESNIYYTTLERSLEICKTSNQRVLWPSSSFPLPWSSNSPTLEIAWSDPKFKLYWLHYMTCYLPRIFGGLEQLAPEGNGMCSSSPLHQNACTCIISAWITPKLVFWVHL